MLIITICLLYGITSYSIKQSNIFLIHVYIVHQHSNFCMQERTNRLVLELFLGAANSLLLLSRVHKQLFFNLL